MDTKDKTRAEGPHKADTVVAGLDPLRSDVVVPDASVLARVRRRALESDAQAVDLPPSNLNRRFALGVVALIAAVVAGALLLVSGPSSNSPVHADYAEAAVRVAEANPRFLVEAPGWSVADAYALSRDDGEMRFSDGEHSLELTWYPARLYQDYVDDRAHVSEVDTSITVDDMPTRTVRYGDTEFATMLPPTGDVFVEVRGDLGSEEAYREVVSSMHGTDINTWLAAMPEKVVQPNEQAEVVDRLLEGVPLPPGFDVRGLRTDLVLDDKALHESVAPAVACGWLDSWAEADKTGDAEAKSAAVDAMATARQWPAFRDANGHDKASIEEYAASIADGKLDRSFGGAVLVTEDGAFAFGPAYAMILDCDSMTKRQVKNPD